MVAASELPIDTSATAMEMAQAIFGDGVTVVSASYTGDNRSSGIYTEGDTVSSGVTPADTGVILSTGRADDFTNSAGTLPWWQGGGPTQANQDNNTSTNTSGFNNNAQFNAAAGTNTYDGAMLSVNFIPTGDVMTMQFVFSSEEFPEYANSQYQDFVGVWVNGQQVEMAVGAANPGNLVGGINQNLYNDNTGSQYNTEMDGFTVTMTLTFPVTAGIVNSIQIGIADVGDSSYDSNLLIAGDSLQTVLIATDDILHLPAGDTKTIDVLATDFAASAGVEVNHVPFKGSSEAMNNVLGGHIDGQFDAVVLRQAQAGAVKPIVILNDERWDGLPDVPTLNELGFKGFEDIASWFGFIAPAGVPEEAVQQFSAAVDQALKDPQVIERLAALGVMPKYLPADKFSTLVQSNYKQYGDILKPLGLTQ